MPIFSYRGYRIDGSEATGTLEADGLNDAASKVRNLGLFPKEIREYIHREKTGFFHKPDTALLPAITRQLSLLLSSGVPLMEALRALSEENRGFWKRRLISVREQVASGTSFSRALEEHKKIFPEFYINMVAAGEHSGTLDKVLVRLADFLEKQNAIRAKIKVSMMYPMFMICVGFIVMSFLFIFVIPKIVKIFEDTKSALPLITIILINISNFFRYYWWIPLIAVISGVLGIRKLLREHRLLVDKTILRLPGSLLQALYLARFSRSLSFLLEGGLPMLKALELSAKSTGNRALELKVLAAGEKVAEGGRLSASLEGFPPVMLQLISVGERSGTLIEVLNKAADSYEEEFHRRVQRALSLLEPSMILLMGIVVGFIVLAVLLPMFQLNQLVR
ncbi:MAG: type II secretion system F family protein [Nitrospirota bacterium]